MTTSLDTPPGPIGLLAGWGRYPIVVAEALRREGRRTFCLGIRGEADAALAGLCDGFRWIGLAKFGHAIRYFKRHRVTEAVMAGKIHKITLFQPWRWIRHLPDWRTLRAAIPHFITRREDCRDDTLLNMVVREFAADGIQFQPATDYAPQLLVPPGQITRRGPSPWQWKDIEFGWNVAKQIGALDVGQSVAVKDQTVLAVEAIEGTDACIRRAGTLCRGGAFIVVKVAKPQQDMRFDVPTVGMDTLRTMVESRARVLAIEARKTILLDHAAVVDFADRNKLVIVAMDSGRRTESGT
jgi:UDP-2,3-diacylglucosamine hydrolase